MKDNFIDNRLENGKQKPPIQDKRRNKLVAKISFFAAMLCSSCQLLRIRKHREVITPCSQSNALRQWLLASSRPSIDHQRDGHTYRLYAWIGAGSSHCDREGSGRRSGQRWWWRWRLSRTSAAADAKQHSERASRKDQPWNVPPGSVAMNKQNHHQNADGPQRPSTDAEVRRGKPQHRPRHQLGPGCGSHRHRRRVARSRVRGESCRSRRR